MTGRLSFLHAFAQALGTKEISVCYCGFLQLALRQAHAESRLSRPLPVPHRLPVLVLLLCGLAGKVSEVLLLCACDLKRIFPAEKNLKHVIENPQSIKTQEQN